VNQNKNFSFDNHLFEEEAIEEGKIIISGAREHNLKNISLELPRNKLVVFTGLSGSGKSSLAFDTLFAEGQRRYMETFASYARQYIGEMKRPDVEKIEGLSPVISIEQKTTSRNPRSTVGTVTEIYDFLRLLYARAADAYSYVTGKKMVSYTEDQLLQNILEKHDGKQVMILAPIVRSRKGHYRELFEQFRRRGFTKVRVDKSVKDIVPKMQLSRYSIHDIEVVIDRLTIQPSKAQRIKESLQLAIKEGKGSLMIIEELKDQSPFYYSKNLMCPESGISYDEPQPNTFSFNSPYGYCPECKGFGKVYKIDEETLVLDKNKSLKEGGVLLPTSSNDNWTLAIIRAIANRYNTSLDVPIKNLPKEVLDKVLYGTDESLLVKTAFVEYETAFEGLVAHYKNQLEDKENPKSNEELKENLPYSTCPGCNGSRLKKESLYFKIDKKDISQASQMQIDDFFNWVSTVESRLSKRQKQIASELLKEIVTRTKFLVDVGLEYLSLDRPVYSLSGGEAQRIRLATQIGSQLINVTYVIDEPSIGLHQRDNHRLISALKDLRAIGNSVIVVEHDKDMMLESDFVVDLGPKAGRHGGEITYIGNPDGIEKSGSITADYLTGRKEIEVPEKRREGNGEFIRMTDAKGHNLKNISLEIPIGKLICVTGVSGSGKSSLINETLVPIIKKQLYRSKPRPLAYKKIEGLENIDKIIEIDQSPIGRTPRSNPATYTGTFTLVRDLFSKLPEAKIRGYKPGRFSFNVKGGRCEECQGAGVKTIEMNFLPDVYIKCPSCQGKRYNRETLEVRYKGKSINDVLNMTHNQGLEFFENIPKLKRKLKTMVDVGMGYVTLGQSSVTLSGGEAQRIKLAAELSKRDTGKTLFILDEPTTGLHFEDIRVLMEVLNKFLKRGNTVLIIEHNMDVIKLADHIIDMGPEGGEQGGQIVCLGTPEEIVKNNCGHTAGFLKRELKEKN
jgi:excinuclease ABC subunit A